MSDTPWGYVFFSRIRTDSSIESSSKGFMLCFTPAVSTAVWALFTRGLTCGVVLSEMFLERAIGAFGGKIGGGVQRSQLPALRGQEFVGRTSFVAEVK
jgi:hypothetical protein